MASLSFAPRKHFQRKITLPADKSILHRALILNAIALGDAFITASDYGEDNKSTIKALQALGVEIVQQKACIKIQGRGPRGLQAPKAALDCGNSATTMRLLSGVLAALNFESELIGDASLQKRPMQRIVTPLQGMGAKIFASKTDTAPLQIQPATLHAIEYEMPIPSAQVKSALLLAGLVSGQAVTLFEPASSRDHTERLLQAMQIKLEVEEGRIYLPAQQTPQAMDVQVPGDFSAAAYFIAAACLAQRADVNIPQVNVNPTRTGLLRYLLLMGAPIKMQNQQWFGHEPVADIHIKTVKKLQAVQVRAEHIPSLIDELPLLFLLAAKAQGTTIIPNVGELRHKECDRLQAMVSYLTAMGVAVTLDDDKIAITGRDELLGGAFDCLQDHRMAMTLAIASFASTDTVHIEQGDCFKVSFPNFLQAIR
jgi:3-phosphoshikimate 1-carboxyvinyltransferase